MSDPTGSATAPADERVQDDRLRHIWRADPDALGGPPSRPLSVSSPVLENTIVQLGLLSAPFGRRLLREEKALLDDFYQGAVDTGRIRVVETRIANAPTTLGNQIRIAPGRTFETEHEM
ncbi:MAG: hypothetical protein AAFW98_01335 [Pseudomonadota bacterium]